MMRILRRRNRLLSRHSRPRWPWLLAIGVLLAFYAWGISTVLASSRASSVERGAPLTESEPRGKALFPHGGLSSAEGQGSG